MSTVVLVEPPKSILLWGRYVKKKRNLNRVLNGLDADDDLGEVSIVVGEANGDASGHERFDFDSANERRR